MQFYNVNNRALSVDLPFDSQTVSDPPVQSDRQHHRCQQIGNLQMEWAIQYYQQIDIAVAWLLYTQQFHWQMLDQLEIVFVVLNLQFVVLQLGFVDMYLCVVYEGRQKETNKQKEERRK